MKTKIVRKQFGATHALVTDRIQINMPHTLPCPFSLILEFLRQKFKITKIDSEQHDQNIESVH